MTFNNKHKCLAFCIIQTNRISQSINQSLPSGLKIRIMKLLFLIIFNKKFVLILYPSLSMLFCFCNTFKSQCFIKVSNLFLLKFLRRIQNRPKWVTSHRPVRVQSFYMRTVWVHTEDSECESEHSLKSETLERKCDITGVFFSGGTSEKQQKTSFALHWISFLCRRKNWAVLRYDLWFFFSFMLIGMFSQGKQRNISYL